MRTARALIAADPLEFGRGPAWQFPAAGERRWTVSDDLKLFGSTFAAGFLFVSLLIA